MIVFKSVEAKNFFSIGENSIKINLNENKITLVTGENGAGKTMALVDSICFCIFNKPYRKINKGEIVNSINEKGCLVVTDFDIGTNQYQVKRGVKPNIFEIYKNGELINQDADSKEYQRMLEKDILRMSYESFIQVVILSSAKFDPFMGLDTPKRRAVVEDLLDIEVFSKMNTLLKQEISTLKDDDFKAETSYKSLKSQIDTVEQTIEELKTRDDQLKQEKQAEIDRYEKDILELQSKIKKDYRKTITDAQKIRKQKEDVKTERSIDNQRARSDINKLQSKLSKIKEWCECPECFSTIDEPTRQNIISKIQEQINLKEFEIGNNDSKIKKYEKELKEIDNILNDLLEKQTNIDSIQNKINLYNRRLEDLNIEISRMETSSSQSAIKSNEVKLSKLNEEYVKQKSEYDRTQEELKYRQYIIKLLKDDGIKAKIIEQYIPVINKGINYYLEKFNFFVNFNLDENFNETIRERHINNRSYNSFSQGEKQRFDLAILFTWRDVAKIKNSLSTNLLIMDETFDGSMDWIGLNYLNEILDSQDEKSNIFIISHKQELSEQAIPHIRFEKKGNFTTMGYVEQ